MIQDLDTDHRIVNEIDPLKPLNDTESKQVRGFQPEGIKRFRYMGDNIVYVKELPSAIEYSMEYTNVSRILGVCGFIPKKLKLSLEKLVSHHDLIYDFDNRRILVPKDLPVVSPVIKHMSNAVEEFNPVIGGVEEELDMDTRILLNNYKLL